MATIGLRTVTPAMAQQYLDSSRGNRPFNRATLRHLTDDIRNGRWHVTNEGLGFDGEGRLVDGHHRCRAIVDAGVCVSVVVVEGIDLDAVPSIDCGRSRTGQDVAIMHDGHEWASKTLWAVAVAALQRSLSAKGVTSAEQREVSAWLRANPAAVEVVRRLGSLVASRRLPMASIVAGMAVRAHLSVHAPIGRLESFVGIVASHAEHMAVGPGDVAAAALRNWLGTAATAQKSGTRKGTRVERDHAALKSQAALRLFLAGKPVVKIQVVENDIYPFDYTQCRVWRAPA